MGKQILNMTNEKLEDFFNKYNLNELSSFEIILEFAYEYDVKQILSVIRRVYNEKTKELDEEEYDIYMSIVEHVKFKALSIGKENKFLSDNELDFLHDIASNALENIKGIEPHFLEADQEDLSKLIDSVNEEKKNRNAKIKRLTM